MRRKIVFSLAAFFLVLAVITLVYRYLDSNGNAGYVIIGLAGWELEMSLYLVAIMIATAFLLLYLSMRLTAQAAQLPIRMKRRGVEQRGKRSMEALISGVIETTEGNWEKAERSLIRHAADSALPLINYLTAARAAHSRGAHEQREEYLNLARKTVPEADLAISLTRAEMQLASKHHEQALQTLTALSQSAPSHAGVLRLLHRVYAEMADWESLHRLMPYLRNPKVMSEADLKHLETETYRALLEQKARTRDPVTIREIWRHVPVYVRRVQGIEALYCAAMIDAGAGAEVEEEARLALGTDWNEPLLVLYGHIDTGNPEKHLQSAEAWLAPHPEDPILLRVLAQLALRTGEAGKARDYVERSLQAEPSVEAYRILGDMHYERQDYVAAGDYYRKGMMLASGEIVAHSEPALAESPAVEPG